MSDFTSLLGVMNPAAGILGSIAQEEINNKTEGRVGVVGSGAGGGPVSASSQGAPSESAEANRAARLMIKFHP